jgi:hypothetical protein
MAIWLVGMGILILLVLPALLIISACVSASRMSRHEEAFRLPSKPSSSQYGAGAARQIPINLSKAPKSFNSP